MSDTKTNRAAGGDAVLNDGDRFGTTDAATSSEIACKTQSRNGRRSRVKGGRIEREIVQRHLALNVPAERYPLSGGSRFRGRNHDIDLYLWGKEEAPAVAEVKGRKNGGAFVTIESWLATNDLLFLRRNNADPLVVLPWSTWARLIGRRP